MRQQSDGAGGEGNEEARERGKRANQSHTPEGVADSGIQGKEKKTKLFESLSFQPVAKKALMRKSSTHCHQHCLKHILSKFASHCFACLVATVF